MVRQETPPRTVLSNVLLILVGVGAPLVSLVHGATSPGQEGGKELPGRGCKAVQGGEVWESNKRQAGCMKWVSEGGYVTGHAELRLGISFSVLPFKGEF